MILSTPDDGGQEAKRTAIVSTSAPKTVSWAPVLVRLADVCPEPIRWLWPGRIALGKLTLLSGDPGLGKSFVTLDIAARVSKGMPWPDDPALPTEAGGVVLLSAEDDVADTIRPRLDAADGDVERISALTAVRQRSNGKGETEIPFNLKRDLAMLEAAVRQTPDCRLVVIDPITAYLGGTDSHKNADIRELLAPLSDLAARHDMAIIAVTHLNKNEAGSAIYRSMGSLAFTAAARAVWMVTKDKADSRRRLMLPVKNNLALDVLGLAYSIEPRGVNDGPVVVWEADPVELSADAALAADRGGDDSDGAGDWLRETLSSGEMPSTDVLQEGLSNGYSDKAVRKAFKAIGARRRREGFGRGGIWYWSLPESLDDPQTPIVAIDAQSQETGNNANNGQEWGEI